MLRRRQTATSTLMPPTHLLTTPKLGGFVCRTCLSRLRRPQRPQALWLIRNKTDGPRRQNHPQTKNKDPTFRYFDQTPDGTRKEAADDAKHAAILKDVEERIRLVGEEEDDLDELVGENEPSPVELLRQVGKEYAVPESMVSAREEMETQMAEASNLETLSEEERSNLRNRLLNFDGMSIH